MISAAMIRKNAPHQVSMVCRVVRIGTVHTVPRTPKAIRIGRRPILSERLPTIGCRHMNRNRVAAEMVVESLMLMPTVLTRYFCM
ncbi:hypothetical protein D3C76_1689020 [compost metagenome]